MAISGRDSEQCFLSMRPERHARCSPVRRRRAEKSSWTLPLWANTVAVLRSLYPHPKNKSVFGPREQLAAGMWCSRIVPFCFGFISPASLTVTGNEVYEYQSATPAQFGLPSNHRICIRLFSIVYGREGNIIRLGRLYCRFLCY